MANGMSHARERGKPPAKELDHIRIYPGEKGGHVLEHNFTSYDHPAEKYPFAKGDGAGVHAHLEKYAGVKDSAAAEENSEL